MRKLLTGMKVSIDGKIEGSEGFADWVDAWSEDYGFTARIDACIIGGNMYPGYEGYWSAIRNAPDQPLPMTGKLPHPDEVKWAEFIPSTTHYVLSTSLESANWPNTKFIRTIDEIAALKNQPGKDIYVMGGAQIVSSLIDAGLMDELRLIIYPLIAGDSKGLFSAIHSRQGARLLSCDQLTDGRVSLAYALA